ncbi:MAG: heparan-alpha-glucosaminide N-acetyltransferase domain-containing protein [Flavobacteriaceae bacterium]|nr:heparan-alpha-glucosaminide N-acetyltransferase domain-containing protein [Flavobacteriaceae bacterium]
MKTRIQSVDLFRGLTIAAMILVNTPGTWGAIYAPLEHSAWHGLTPTDLIFPFFLFIVGLSISLAYKNKVNNAAAYKKIIIRSLKIIGLGLFLNLFLPYFPFIENLETVRIPGVLQRIGVVFLIAAVINLNFSWKSILIISLSILIIYWLWMGFVPLNGMKPSFERVPNNWASYLDLKIFGKHTWRLDYDPEGLLSTFPSVVSSLAGILVGKILMAQGDNKVIKFIWSGIAMLVIGLIWNNWFPINKALWSSSFVLVTSGLATLLLALIYFISDIKKIKIGGIFKHLGTNAISIYFLSYFLEKTFGLVKVNENQSVHQWLYHTFFTSFITNQKLASLSYALVAVALYLWLGYSLFKRKIFIKV